MLESTDALIIEPCSFLFVLTKYCKNLFLVMNVNYFVGVPQGDSLAPLFFILLLTKKGFYVYVESMSAVCSFKFIHVYTHLWMISFFSGRR